MNIIINYFLIPILGIEGASIATLIGYIVSDILCMIVLYRMKLMMVSRRFIIVSLVMSGFMILWRLLFSDQILIGTIGALLITIIALFLYREEIKKVINIANRRKVNQ